MSRWTAGLLVALFAVVAALAMGAPDARADQRNLTLINGSGVTIVDVYVSAADIQDWQDDILGRDVLLPGEEAEILFSRFDGEAGVCLYDIRVIADTGAEGFLYGVDLCSTLTVTFT